MAEPFRVIEDGLLIQCRVSPSASRDEILGLGAGGAHLKIKVSAVPEKGRANKAAIKLLAKSLGLPKTAFEVISGPTSRMKTIKVSGQGKDLMAKVRGLF